MRSDCINQANISSKQTQINRIIDETGQDWEVEEVVLDVSKTGLGFSISGGRDRELDPVFGDKYIRVTDISPGVL